MTGFLTDINPWILVAVVGICLIVLVVKLLQKAIKACIICAVIIAVCIAGNPDMYSQVKESLVEMIDGGTDPLDSDSKYSEPYYRDMVHQDDPAHTAAEGSD